MMKRVRCTQCRSLTAPWDLVHVAKSDDDQYMPYCIDCCNGMMAERAGLTDFQAIPFESMELTDADGIKHWFHFRTRLFGSGVALDAFEFPDAYGGGYRFQVIGTTDEDQMQLFAGLLEKMRRGLSYKHITPDGGSNRWRIMPENGVVRGRIGAEKKPRGAWMPVVVIDGKAIPWDTFGQMLLTYEGFQFKVEIRHMPEEV